MINPTENPLPVNTEQGLIILRDSLRKPGSVITVSGLTGSSAPWLFSGLPGTMNRPLVWVTPDQREAERVAADLSFFTDLPVLVFPCLDSLPFVPVLPSPETLSQRISALYRLGTEQGPAIVVTPVRALAETTVPVPVLLDNIEYLMNGEETDRNRLCEWLIRVGYEHASVVQTKGEFAVRGGILDLFPPACRLPVRVDFFGDRVEEMRLFDPATQRSLEDINELVILPVREIICTKELAEAAQERLVKQAAAYDWPARRIYATLEHLETGLMVEGHGALSPVFYPRPGCLLDYVSGDVPLLFQEPNAAQAALERFLKAAEADYDAAVADHRVLSALDSLVLDRQTLSERMKRKGCILLEGLTVHAGRQTLPFDLPGPSVTELAFRTVQPDIPVVRGDIRKSDLLGPVVDRLEKWLEEGHRVIIAVPGERQGHRLIDLLSRRDMSIKASDITMTSASAAPCAGSPGLEIRTGRLSSGFHLPGESLTLITEEELLGNIGRRSGKTKKRRATISELTFEDLKPGQPVVHRDHGICLYQGLVGMEVRGISGEYLLLQFRDGDKLYLPVDRLGLIQKYVGVEGRTPRLDKLGGSGWQLTKKKVRKAIYEIAHELVDLYAARKVREGFSFSPPDAMFRQFEAAFPFEETPDQAASIEEVMSDMEAPRPMDRLLCGDVGYGKTEVAMRAVFKAVEDGRQVAVLVPTTLLAEQHERTFRRRLERFPVSVCSISRLKSRRRQREILSQVSSGSIDVLVGTHRILQSDVTFKNLGLLIVDEEHRFGVRHKERLKKLKQTVDCLTLTATPIPRTLQLSLLGLRDLSTIATPPSERVPTKTFLAEFDDSLIRHAIEAELERKGQIFFVHNRIKGLERLTAHIKRLVPAARTASAHGRMNPDELERIMIRFVRGELDCLVCTTIIESGIDIPTANTMIINRADRLGLADLYQLRGRVGRGNEQAYAYLLVPDVSRLSGESGKRLKAVMELSEAGGGFRLAMHDLQIRGAGNILGISQSGQIADVGYELYLDLLQSAVEELKGMPPREEIDPEVNVAIPAFIPQEYVPDVEQRLILYRRMSRIEDGEADEFLSELSDRFGPPPQETLQLLQVMEIKRTLRRLNVTRLDLNATAKEMRMLLSFGPGGPPDAAGLLKTIEERRAWRLLPDERLVITLRPEEKHSGKIAAIKRNLQGLAETTTK